jgi:hypothetical protein
MRCISKFLIIGLTASLLLAACSSSSSVSLPSIAKSTEEITNSYVTLFNGNNPNLQEKVNSIQNGAPLEKTLAHFLGSPIAKGTHAKVIMVHVLSAVNCKTNLEPYPCAIIDYELLTATNSILLPAATGFAVWWHNRWVVAKTTICSLLALENGGHAPSGC